MPDKENAPAVRRIALVMNAKKDPHESFYFGTRFKLEALGNDGRHERGKAGYAVIRVDRVSLAKLKAMCAQLPTMLTAGENGHARTPEPLSMVELIMAIAGAELERLEVLSTQPPAASSRSRSGPKKVSTVSRSGSRPKKVSTRMSSSRSRKVSTRLAGGRRKSA